MTLFWTVLKPKQPKSGPKWGPRRGSKWPSDFGGFGFERVFGDFCTFWVWDPDLAVFKPCLGPPKPCLGGVKPVLGGVKPVLGGVKPV